MLHGLEVRRSTAELSTVGRDTDRMFTLGMSTVHRDAGQTFTPLTTAAQVMLPLETTGRRELPAAPKCVAVRAEPVMPGNPMPGALAPMVQATTMRL